MPAYQAAESGKAQSADQRCPEAQKKFLSAEGILETVPTQAAAITFNTTVNSLGANT